MPTQLPPAPRPSRKARIVGWVLTVLPAPLLAFSAAMKFVMSKEVAEGFEHLGWPTRLAIPLGILELSCVVLLLIPRTAVLGAVLLTGYMGGAIATHVRIGEPFIVQSLIPIVAWLGLYLRDPRLRALLPLRSPAP
jgi:uncharacterized membrane protein YphA (DoxX/SURF4 family)